MSFTILTRQLFLLLFVALWPTWAFALKETYEGFLVPNNGDTPVSIVVELEDLETFLFGRVKVSPPLKGNSPIEAGRIVAGTCNLATALSPNVTLRLFGSCDANAFEGIFTLFVTEPKKIGRGTFKLLRKAPEKGKDKVTGSDVASTSSVAACLKANTRCLTACPRGGDSAEYLCANRCRTKLQACKKASKIDADE